MAYGLRYRLSYCNVNGTPLRLELHKNEYTGTVADITGSGEPFILKRLNDQGKEGAIITSEAIIQIREQDGFLLEDIYTADEREYRVEFYYNNQIEWIGYLLPDYFSRELNGFPVIELSAIDCLGTLKDVPYLDADNKPFTGRQTLLEVVTNCLSSTDIDLPLDVVIDLLCDEWTPVEGRELNFLQDTFIHSERFSDSNGRTLSKYDILKSVLNMAYARLVQYDGFWKVTNKEQIQRGIGVVRTFNMDGQSVPELDMDGNIIDRLWFMPAIVEIPNLLTGGTQSIMPVNGVTQVYSEHGRLLPLPKNNTFKGYENGSYPNWTSHNNFQFENTNIEPVRYNSDGTIRESRTGDKYYPMIKSVPLYGPDKALWINISPYIESEAIIIEGEDRINFSITFSGIYDDPFVIVILYRDDKGREFTLDSAGNWIEKVVSDAVDVGVKAHLRFVIDKPPGRTNISPPAMEGTATRQSSPFPNGQITGKVFVRIYGHEKANDGGAPVLPGSKWQLTLKSLVLTKELSSGYNKPKGIIYGTVINGKFSKKSEVPTVLFSDKVMTGMGGYFEAVISELTSDIQNLEGDLTLNWASGFGGEINEPLLTITSSQMSRSHQTALKQLNVSFEADNIFFESRYRIAGLEGLYMVVSSSVNYTKGIVSATLMECFKCG